MSCFRLRDAAKTLIRFDVSSLAAELHGFRRVVGDQDWERPMRTQTHTHFDEQERISTAVTELLALGLVAALAFSFVL